MVSKWQQLFCLVHERDTRLGARATVECCKVTNLLVVFQGLVTRYRCEPHVLPLETQDAVAIAVSLCSIVFAGVLSQHGMCLQAPLTC